jgi:hypothetical protein
MTRRFRGWLGFPVGLAAISLLGGCHGGDDEGGGEPIEGGPPGREGPGSPGIKRIMIKLARGPQSLTTVIGNELTAGPVAWETVQGHAKEYAQSASELGQYDPPRGTKESWKTLSESFAQSAAELDRAAQAKNKENAAAALDQLKNSCDACHREHRRMGRGGRGGPPGPGPRGGPGGPPPGGPGAPPPDGPGAPGGPPPRGPGGPPAGGPN